MGDAGRKSFPAAARGGASAWTLWWLVAAQQFAMRGGPLLVGGGDRQIRVARRGIDDADDGEFLLRQAVEVARDRREVPGLAR